MPQLFDRLTPATRATMQQLGRSVRYPPGTAVMFPGQVGDSLHVLMSGTVKIATLRRLGWIETERRRIVVHELEALRNRATI